MLSHNTLNGMRAPERVYEYIANRGERKLPEKRKEAKTMRIANNITAINSHRNYGINQAGIAKNIEKLSSGYRINRAGDDAAGLAISEKMRAQIRGLTMASKNSQDAISLVQTAEGALQSAHNILQRMRELAVQSASDTNETTIDRAALQQEFAQLIAEINDTAAKTKFNDQALIDGTFAKNITTATTTNPGVNVAWADDRLAKTAPGGEYTISFATILAKAGVSIAYGTSTATLSFVVSSLNGPVTVAFEGTQCVVGEKFNGVWNVRLSGGKIVAENLRTGQLIDAEFSALTAAATVSVKLGGLGTLWFTNLGSAPIDDDSFTSLSGQFNVTKAVDERQDIYKHVAVLSTGEQVVVETGQTTINFKNSGISVKLRDSIVANGQFSAPYTGVGIITIAVSKGEGKALTIQTGANEGDRMQINLGKMDAYSLGIANSNISNRMDATVAITQVNTALNVVSTQRAALGALQNRLEFKISNLDIGAENLQAAESRIRDVDMAKEMTSFMRNNILFQASTAMLAQANALPQGVLQLLG